MNQTTINNPFTPDAPVQKFELFFGRQVNVEEILDFMDKGQSVSVTGSKQMGKSSLLHHLTQPQLWKEYSLSVDNFHTLHLDCQAFSKASCEDFFTHVGQFVAKSTQQTILPTYTFHQLEDLCRRQYKVGGRATLVVMLDAFEALIDNSQADYDFFSNLRSLNSNYRVVYVAASQLPLSQLEQGKFEKTKIDSSQFSNIFHPVPLKGLKGLEEKSVRKLLDKYFAEAALPTESIVIPLLNKYHGLARVREWIQDRFWGNNMAGWQPLVETIVTEAKGHPKLIQQMGAQAVDAWVNCNGQAWSRAAGRALRQRFNKLRTASDSNPIPGV